MRQLFFSFLFFICAWFSLRAQVLKPGDKCPDVKLGKVLNGPVQASTLHGLNKYVLLDFGSTDCIPCLTLLSKLNHLQEKFKERLQIFMVTKEPAAKVERFLKNVPIAKGLKVSIIAEDSLLTKTFPHYGIPHEVWLAPDGEILGITKHEYVTEENIHAVLSGIKPTWPIKADIEYDEGMSLAELASTNKIHHSIISRYMEGVRSIGKAGEVDPSLRFQRFINYTIFELYNIAYKHSLPTPYPRLFLIDPTLHNDFFYDPRLGYKEEWERKVSYCYEILFDSTNENEMYKKMRADLDFSFGFVSYLQISNIDCWVITKVGEPVAVPGKKERSVQSLISSLNRNGKFPLIVNETGLTTKQLGKIYLEADDLVLTKESLIFQVLRKYGFEITKGKREINLLVIERKK
jgi:thiol-disulfide isomerase/thioredoxin